MSFEGLVSNLIFCVMVQGYQCHTVQRRLIYFDFIGALVQVT